MQVMVKEASPASDGAVRKEAVSGLGTAFIRMPRGEFEPVSAGTMTRPVVVRNSAGRRRGSAGRGIGSKGGVALQAARGRSGDRSRPLSMSHISEPVHRMLSLSGRQA